MTLSRADLTRDLFVTNLALEWLPSPVHTLLLHPMLVKIARLALLCQNHRTENPLINPFAPIPETTTRPRLMPRECLQTPRGVDPMLIPYRVDAPMSRWTIANYLIFTLIVAVSVLEVIYPDDIDIFILDG